MIKILSNATVQTSLLILVLSFYAWSLRRDIGVLKAGETRLVDIANANVRLAYRRPSGIAVDGQLISPTPGQKRYIAFLLRGESLQQDLDFWSRTRTLIGLRKDIALFGYCDSQVCVDTIRKMQSPPFPVLAYGEAASIQAVVNKDRRGRAVLSVVGGPIDAFMVQ